MLRLLATFSSVGLAATLAYLALSALLAQLHVTPWLASLLCYAAIIPLAYLAQHTLTFRSKSAHRSSFPKYVSTQFLGLLLSAALPYSLAGVLPPLACFALVSLSVAVINFVLLRWWAFKPERVAAP